MMQDKHQKIRFLVLQSTDSGENYSEYKGRHGMIKNIVFDMGKVLLDYDSMRACRHFAEGEEDQKLICSAVFDSQEWTLLDLGFISEEEGLARMCAHLPKRLRPAAKQCFDHWPEYCMWKIAPMENLVRELKAKGYGLYICSNASIRLTSCCMEVIPAAECFDGMLFSAEIKYMKPQKEMYEQLFLRFDLKPEECYFIDDLPMNIEGARACGMDGHCFADGSIENLKKDLEKILL